MCRLECVIFIRAGRKRPMHVVSIFDMGGGAARTAAAGPLISLFLCMWRGCCVAAAGKRNVFTKPGVPELFAFPALWRVLLTRVAAHTAVAYAREFQHERTDQERDDEIGATSVQGSRTQDPCQQRDDGPLRAQQNRARSRRR